MGLHLKLSAIHINLVPLAFNAHRKTYAVLHLLMVQEEI